MNSIIDFFQAGVDEVVRVAKGKGPFVTHMPQRAQSAYNSAVLTGKWNNWFHIVKLAFEDGVTDPNKLADIPFYLYHPELGNRPLGKHEKALADEWIGWRDSIRNVIPAMRMSLDELPPLKLWLKKVDVSAVKPRDPRHAVKSNELRLRAVERMRDFLVNALADASYSADYWTFDQETRHSGRISVEVRGGVPLGVYRTGKENAVGLLKRYVREGSRAFKDLDDHLVAVERRVYVHTDCIVRWARSGATNDGTSSYENEINWLEQMVGRLENKGRKTIYWVYREDVRGAYKAIMDPNPRTAGVPSDD